MKNLIAALLLLSTPAFAWNTTETDVNTVLMELCDKVKGIPFAPIPDTRGKDWFADCMTDRTLFAVADGNTWSNRVVRILGQQALTGKKPVFVFVWGNTDFDADARWRLQLVLYRYGVKIKDVGEVGELPPALIAGHD